MAKSTITIDTPINCYHCLVRSVTYDECKVMNRLCEHDRLSSIGRPAWCPLVEVKKDPIKRHEEIVASANDMSFVQDALNKPEIQEILNQEDNVGDCPTCGSGLYYCEVCGATGLNGDEYKNHVLFCDGEK